MISTMPATVSSERDERMMDCADSSLPSVGRSRFQLNAPNENTIATATSFAINANPYGVDQSDESGFRCRHAVITPNSTTRPPNDSTMATMKP